MTEGPASFEGQNEDLRELMGLIERHARDTDEDSILDDAKKFALGSVILSRSRVPEEGYSLYSATIVCAETAQESVSEGEIGRQALSMTLIFNSNLEDVTTRYTFVESDNADSLSQMLDDVRVYKLDVKRQSERGFIKGVVTIVKGELETDD